MGNACCCDCYVEQGRRRAGPNFQNTNPHNIHRDQDLLGGKGTGHRVYNKYQSRARKPIPYPNNKHISEPRGRENPAYHADDGEIPPPANRARRKPGPRSPGNSRLATVHGTRNDTNNIGNDSPRPGNIRNVQSQQNLTNSSLDPDDEACEANFVPGHVKATVLGISSKESLENNQNAASRRYSVATTVSLGRRTGGNTPSIALVRVEALGHSWILHKSGPDFEQFIRHIKSKATAAEKTLLLQEGQEVTIQQLSNFLLFVLMRHHLLNEPVTLKFFELNKVAAYQQPPNHSADESSSRTADVSGSTSSGYSISNTSDSSAIDPNNTTHNTHGSTNTLCAQVSSSGTNININLSYEVANDQLIVDRRTRELRADSLRSRTSSRASHISTQTIDLRRGVITRNSGVVTHQPMSRSDYPISAPPIPVPSSTQLPSSQPPSQPHRLLLLAPPLPATTPPPPYDVENGRGSRVQSVSQISSLRPHSDSRRGSVARTVELPPKYGGGAPASIIGEVPAGAGESATPRGRRERHTSINLDNLDGPQETMSPSDFKFLGVIGKGSFGQVLLARHIATNKPYAVKMLSKRIISRRKETQHVLSERSVLIKVLHHPYLVQLHYAFTTRHKIFFVLDFVNGGELFFHLQRERVFSEPRAMFYAAEICCALSYIHTKEIVYRDLKPENLLLDKEGHVVLTDFGLCKEGIQSSSSRTGTFCGTPEYLAPEILLKKPYTRVVDWWTLGAVLYEMLYGLPPFYSSNQMTMYEAIISKPLKLKSSTSTRVRNLLFLLLKKNPEDRLGSGPEDGEAVKSHEFFRSIDWLAVDQRRMKPPFVPKVTSDTDTRNIDPSFTRELVRIGSVSPAQAQDKASSAELNNLFKGFSYARPLSRHGEEDEEDEEELDR